MARYVEAVRASCISVAICAASVLTVDGAHANGRFPATDMLVVDPAAPSHFVLRATYGLLFSRDGGARWDWICERAVGYGPTEDPTVAITANGVVLAGTFGRLARSTDGGCTWPHDETLPEGVLDLAVRPETPRRVYAVTTHLTGVDDHGASRYRSAFSVSTDAGAHWSSRATLDPTLVPSSIEVAPRAPTRAYVSAARARRGGPPTGVLLESRDDGLTWIEHTIELEGEERGVLIAAVDPVSPDRLYLRTSGLEVGRLLVSDDAGKTTRTIFRGGPLAGFALADGGKTLFVGGTRDGTNRASASDFQFEKRSPEPIQCLLSVGPTLWACAPSVRGFVVGASSDGGRTYTPKLTLPGARRPARCAGDAVNAECDSEWAALRGLIDGLGSANAAGSTTPTAIPRQANGVAEAPIAPAASVEQPRTTPTSEIAAPVARRSAWGCSTLGSPGRGGDGIASLIAVAFAAARMRRRTVRLISAPSDVRT